jgi:hypothetical protein
MTEWVLSSNFGDVLRFYIPHKFLFGDRNFGGGRLSDTS